VTPQPDRECHETAAAPVPDPADPRLTGERLRTVDAPSGTITLVGSVHAHPASIHRAARTVADRQPAVLALEVPPLALPLFERYADGADPPASPPTLGGEMTAAIAAADTDRVVGIDGPSRPFLAALTRRLARERPPREAVSSVLAGLRSAGGEALRCRLAATRFGARLGRPSVATPADHDCAPTDSPDAQATDEASQIARARAVMDTFEPSRAAQFRDETREAHMARRLRTLREEGPVVAVVGYGHLDALTARLRDEDP
jgi:pheromone shutdown protein TraB